MTWTNAKAYSEYQLLKLWADNGILSGCYQPANGEVKITPGGIEIPIFVSGTVEDISVTVPTHVPSNTLVTIASYDKRRTDQYKPSEWNRFTDSRNYREGAAANQANDLRNFATGAFYDMSYTNGTLSALGVKPTGEEYEAWFLTQIATLRSWSQGGAAPKMTAYLTPSGSAAFIQHMGTKIRYADAADPFFGTWMGVKLYVATHTLSGSGTVVGGIFSDKGAAYAPAAIEVAATGQIDDLTGMRKVSSFYTYGLGVLDATQNIVGVELDPS